MIHAQGNLPHERLLRPPDARPHACAERSIDPMSQIWFERALRPSGWADNVLVTIDDGAIRAVVPDAAGDGLQKIRGVAVPGMPNLHSHAFQRAMAGLTERAGSGEDSFWAWRE